MRASNNDNIKLFHYSAGGGNTCWLQSALVVIQGEQKYIDAIQNYNNLYEVNVNSDNINDKLEAKLMKSIQNFLNDKTDQNIAEISKSYQDYVKYNNNDTSIANQQDINVSYGGSFDATTFLGHIENIFFKNKIKKATDFPANRLVLNDGYIMHNQTYNNDTKYILSYTPGHWVVYKKEGDYYVKYDTLNPKDRQKFLIFSDNKQLKFYPYYGIHKPYYDKKINKHFLPNDKKVHFFPNNNFVENIYNPIYQPIQKDYLNFPETIFPQTDFNLFPTLQNYWQNIPATYQKPFNELYMSQTYGDNKNELIDDIEDYYDEEEESEEEEITNDIKPMKKPPEPAYTGGQIAIMILAYLCGIFTGILVHYLFYKKFKEPQELAVEEYEKQQKAIKNEQSTLSTNNVKKTQTQGNSK